MASPSYNAKNPAVKRIMQEIKEMQAQSSADFMAEALETDIFEWHFVVRGPPETEFEGGIYHGRILLPAEYPFKPPAFMMLTPSGRFETNMKICLSISSHHPEHWQPSWSVRTALTALVAFMPSPGAGALGSLDYTKEERVKLAAKSRVEPPKFGSAERQKVIEDMHARMLALTAEAQAGPSGASKADVDSADAQQQAPGSTDTAAATAAPNSPLPQAAQQQGERQPATPASPIPVTPATPAKPATTPATPATPATKASAAQPSAAATPATPRAPTATPQRPFTPATAASVGTPRTGVAGAAPRTPATPATPLPGGFTLTGAAAMTPEAQRLRALQQQHVQQQQSGDRGLSLLALALVCGIVAILMRKVLVATGFGMGAHPEMPPM